MPTQILMPALSPTMEEGKLAKWLVKEGDKITAGKVVAEIETDKATMEVEAIDEGTVAKILVPEGSEGVKVNTPIALIAEEGESVDEVRKSVAETAPSAPQPTAPTPAPQPAAASPAPQAAATEAGPPVGAAPAAAPRPAPAERKPNGEGTRIFASPLARRLAREAGIDLASIKGSGPHGRIIKRDVETAVAEPGKVIAMRPAMEAAPRPAALLAMPEERILALYAKSTYELVRHENMRRIMAERLTLAKQTIPHLYLSIDCRIDALLEARERINASAP